MENASKALLIAGGMLIAIVLLSFMSYFFSMMGQSSSDLYAEFRESDVTEFNQKFLNYEGKILTVHDVVSIINCAKNNNNIEKLPVTVVVEVDDTDCSSATQEELNDFIKSNMSTKFEIKNIEIPNNLVKKVEIQHKN